jgi:hypothetical protein
MLAIFGQWTRFKLNHSMEPKSGPCSVWRNAPTDLMARVQANWLRCSSTVKDDKQAHCLPMKGLSSPFRSESCRSSTDSECGGSSRRGTVDANVSVSGDVGPRWLTCSYRENQQETSFTPIKGDLFSFSSSFIIHGVFYHSAWCSIDELNALYHTAVF